MFLSSVTALCIWFLYSDRAVDFYVDFYGLVFNLVFISAWNAIDIVTIESYPTHLR
jgi:hypothetical protein